MMTKTQFQTEAKEMLDNAEAQEKVIASSLAFADRCESFDPRLSALVRQNCNAFLAIRDHLRVAFDVKK